MVGAGDVNNAGVREVFEAAVSHGYQRTLIALSIQDTGLTVVAFSLQDISEADGGFAATAMQRSCAATTAPQTSLARRGGRKPPNSLRFGILNQK